MLMNRNKPELLIAIAGMGKMGSYHLQALEQLAAGEFEDYYKGNIGRQLSKIRICGICDIDERSLQTFGRIQGFSDFEQMLEVAKPDMVIIAVPTSMHKRFASASLQRGIHTFVEKPIVANSGDLDDVISLSVKHQCRLMAGHIERYNPVSIKIKSLLEKSQPPAQSYNFIRTQIHHARISDDIITDKVIHDLDLAIYFFGPIQAVSVESIKLSGLRVHEAKLKIEHVGGACGSIFVSWINADHDKCRQVTIAQGGHTWKGDFAAKKLWVDDLEIICHVDGLVNAENNQIKDELVDFIASCCDLDDLKIVPLLGMEEIIEATRWLEYINNKCSEMENGK